MTRLPNRRKRERSGILRNAPRVWRRHQQHVRGHDCCVPDCLGRPIVFAHVRSSRDGGTGLKPHDWFGISLCWSHHDEQTKIGEPAFEREYGIDMQALAAEFARRSPIIEMREAMKEYGYV